MASSAVSYAAIGMAAAAIAIAGAALAFLQAPGAPVQTEPERREFHLFSMVNPDISEELGIPPDLFNMSEMTVNKGDTVVIHFYNLEPEETEEKHSFTMFGQYETHNDVDASESKTIEFVASESGIFEYQCVYHLPTMRGQLVVLP
jgi:plastocyanin